MDACAAWLARLLTRIGLTDVQVRPGRTAPVITAAWAGQAGAAHRAGVRPLRRPAGRAASAWSTDPFRAVRDGDYLYARGASDDKGQLIAHLAAIEAWLATPAGLPLNLRLVLDGEEEIGSPTLVAAAARQWPPLAADVAVVSDTWMLSPRCPALITGLRGVVGARLEVAGPQRDLHAGAFGGVVASPRRCSPHSSPACTTRRPGPGRGLLRSGTPAGGERATPSGAGRAVGCTDARPGGPGRRPW